jgi:trigger factor
VIGRLDIPVPERLVASEIEHRDHSLDEQLERSGSTRDAYLEARGISAADLSAEIKADAERSVKAGFVLDELARTEELTVEQEELNSYVVEQAYRLGVPPDRLAQEIVDRGQLGFAAGEVLRSKALTLLAERASVTDDKGERVDVEALTAPEEDGSQDGESATGDGEAGDGEAGDGETGEGETAGAEADAGATAGAGS